MVSWCQKEAFIGGRGREMWEEWQCWRWWRWWWGVPIMVLETAESMQSCTCGIINIHLVSQWCSSKHLAHHFPSENSILICWWELIIHHHDGKLKGAVLGMKRGALGDGGCLAPLSTLDQLQAQEKSVIGTEWVGASCSDMDLMWFWRGATIQGAVRASLCHISVWYWKVHVIINPKAAEKWEKIRHDIWHSDEMDRVMDSRLVEWE